MARRLSNLVLPWLAAAILLSAPSHSPVLQALSPAGPGFATPTVPAGLQLFRAPAPQKEER